MTEEVLTYEECLALLSEQARAGKVAALVSLERALRPEGPGREDIDAELDRILERGKAPDGSSVSSADR
jgi:hypothetical protein